MLAYEKMRLLAHDVQEYSIYLEKNIPIGSGLGGGSSNAATTLKVLDTLWNLDLSNNELLKIAKSIGSDVPFFIDGGVQYITGIGDKMCEVKLDLSEYIIKFINPHIHINTSEYYKKCTPKFSNKDLRELVQYPVSSWKSNIENDFVFSIL